MDHVPERSVRQRLARSHLLWFVVLGVAIVIVDATVSTEPEEILVDDAVVARLGQLWATQMGQPPNARELTSIIEDWVEEELYVREALRLGLDRKDTIIRRRLAQKLTFLTEDVMVPEPTDRQLRAYFDGHLDRYRVPASFTFTQVFVDASRSQSALDTTAEQLNDGRDYRTLGDATLLSQDFEHVSPGQIMANFGPGFLDGLERFADRSSVDRPDRGLTNQWQGPIASAYGNHFINIREFAPERDAAFVQVKPAVANDFIADERANARREHLATLRARYTVVYAHGAQPGENEAK